MKKKIWFAGIILLLSGLSYLLIYLNSLLPIITGYPAKYLCSAVFISHRDAKSVEELDLNFSFIKYVKNDINETEKSVTSHFLWGKSKAIIREGLGAVLIRGAEDIIVKNSRFSTNDVNSAIQDTIPWPSGNLIVSGDKNHDGKLLKVVTENLFNEKKYGGHPFGFLVIHNGNLVAEKYDKGLNERTRFLSWSMAKSFTNALVGLMVMDGQLTPDQPTGLKEWQGDARKTITIKNLLQMESGLDWNEDYGNRSDVTLMLYDHADFAGYALSKDLVEKPGKHWNYSSGTTNIVNLIMRRLFSTDSAYYAYARERLFNKTGMPDAIFETDASGTQAGSSYVYATARDYGRFGLLYLNDGVFNGERLLPEGWVKFTTTPSLNSEGQYGAFFWLNQGGRYPDAPRDMYSCNGHDGQQIFILPEKKLVVVVLGYSPQPEGNMDFNLLLKDVIGAIKEDEANN